jgi:hypothetical protein
VTSGGGNSGPPRSFGRGFTQEEIRQFGRETRERRQMAEALRDELKRQGQDVRELDKMIGEMRRLETGNAYSDPAQVAVLQESVIEGLKAFEFGLRRQIEGTDANKLVLERSGEVPAGYRPLVDEYYKSLARQKKP